MSAVSLAAYMVQTSLLALLVLLVRVPVARLAGANWAYALWLVPVLVPLLPALPSQILVPAEAVPPAVTILLADVPAVAVAATPVVAAAPAPAASEASQWPLFVPGAWTAGILLFGIWQLLCYRAFIRMVCRDARPGNPPSFRGVPTLQSEAVDGPLALGLRRRLIMLPGDFLTRYSPAERRLALEHELVHHRRGDLWWNLVAMAMLAVHWFNPIAWIAFRAFRCDQELACDAAVMRYASHRARHDYAKALIKSASRPGVIAACPLHHADQLKRRLKMMKTYNPGMLRTLGGIALFASVAAAGLAFGSAGLAQPERRSVGETVSAAIHKDGPLVTREERATIRRKCGEGDDSYDDSLHSENGVLVCRNGKRVDDPEVRAITAAVVHRAQTRVRKVMNDPEVAAAISGEAMERVRDQLRDLEKNKEISRQALARANEQLASLDLDGIRMRAAEEGLAAARESTRSLRLSETIREDVRAALEEAQAEIARIDMKAIMREAEESMDRELRHMRRHPPAPPTVDIEIDPDTGVDER